MMKFSKNFKDLSGKTFHQLTVLNVDHKNRHGQPMYKCSCSCGNEVIVVGGSLRSGNTKSCGCTSRDWIKLPKGESAFRRLFKVYAYSAKKRELEFSLTIDQFRHLVTSNCYYCGCKPNKKTRNINGNGDFTYIGIDRFDNNAGYTQGNSVSCCWMCNKTKSALGHEEFIQWIERVYKHLNLI